MISVVILLAFGAFSIALYFLPVGIASARAHSNVAAIFVFNLLLGWTFLFWVVALVWAFSNPNLPRDILTEGGKQ
jgi:hypothetical protein